MTLLISLIFSFGGKDYTVNCYEGGVDFGPDPGTEEYENANPDYRNSPEIRCVVK